LARGYDPILLEIFRSLYAAVAEEMGVTLRRTAFSPNVKEMRDYSCAVFDRRGELVAQGDHMPVHLGSMPMSVAAAIRAVTMSPGDITAQVAAARTGERRLLQIARRHGTQQDTAHARHLQDNSERVVLPSKCRFSVAAGERIIVETPGDGGWGARDRS
jgi:N-methylhydantoinase B/oxoprolinase/acetone carboxylase alpha subunit